jgi:hypothetical protein
MQLKKIAVISSIVTLSYADFEHEVQQGYAIRVNAAKHQTIDRLQYTALIHPIDDKKIPNYAGSFTKLLEHDSQTGLLTQDGNENFSLLLEALRTGNQQQFNEIKRCPGVERQWANPQAAFAHSLSGPEPATVPLAPPPTLSSAQAAAEILELYCMVLCRDVMFDHYGSGKQTDNTKAIKSLTDMVCKVLADLGDAYQGPKKNNKVEPSIVFRSNAPCDLIGPYISQFLLQPITPVFGSEVGAETLSPDLFKFTRQLPIMSKREFGISWDDFVAIQNGRIPKLYVATDCDAHKKRYPVTGRDLGHFVYTNGLYDPYLLAVQFLVSNNFPFSKAFPYQRNVIKNEGSDLTMGFADVYSLVGQVTLQAYKVCWFHKWRVYRRLRPEAFGGLVHQAKITGDTMFNLHPSIFSSHAGFDILSLILEHNQQQALKSIDPQQLLTKREASTYLLAQIYPEGCPLHPSYPAAHATIAGACSTVIKAFFDDTVLMKSCVKLVAVDSKHPDKLISYNSPDADCMTVGSELDKLASNMAFGRSWGGVHYRSDNEAGLALGEEIALCALQDHARTYHEKHFPGFELTKRNGQRVRITANTIQKLESTNNNKNITTKK